METSPRIVRSSMLTGAKLARGVTVIIDVLRAFSSAAYLFHLGAKEILLLTDPDQVLALKQQEDSLAVGEMNGVPVPGFDLGNSPSQILRAGSDLFSGRTVALRTSAGVAGAVAAAGQSDLLLLGSYVTARATSRFIRQLVPAPNIVTLVAMGEGAKETTPDDERCGDYLEFLLNGRPYDHVSALGEIASHPCTTKFLDGKRVHYSAADALFCLQLDLFDFAIVATSEQGRLVARPVAVY